MRKHPREVDKLVEQVKQRAPLGAPPLGHHGAALFRTLNKLLSCDDRFNDIDAVLFQQPLQLVTNCRQRTVLNLDKALAIDDIDAIRPDWHFKRSVRPRVVLFELSMKRGFHEVERVQLALIPKSSIVKSVSSW